MSSRVAADGPNVSFWPVAAIWEATSTVLNGQTDLMPSLIFKKRARQP